MDWTSSRRVPLILLALAFVASAAITLKLTWHFTFLQDVWDYLINRREFTLDAYMLPHNEHIVVIPVGIQQVLLQLFGMDTAKPEFVVLIIGLLVTDYLVFAYVSRRVGPWFGLFAALLILFLGPAWELLLWPFEISLLGSVLFGLAMVMVLERGDRRGDLLACLFLTLALGFSSLGIPFIAAALVAIMMSPRQRWLRRAYVVIIPSLLFAAWYVGWGRDAESHMTLRNVLASPRFVAEELAVGVGNLFGLGTNPYDGSTEIVFGGILLVVVVAVVGYRQVKRPGFDPGLWPIAAAASANWFLTAFNQMPGRAPVSSRYQYASCVFIVLLLANLLAREQFGKRSILVGAAATVLILGPNLIVLKSGSEALEEQSVLTRTDTAAIEIAERTVPSEFELTPEVAGTPTLVNIFAGPYLEAVEEFGSPAYSEAELLAAPPQFRRQADIVLSQALPLRTVVTPDGYEAGGGRENCVAVPGGASPDSEVALHPGATRIEVAPGEEANFTLRRFAEGEYPVPTAAAPGGSVVVLRVPRDESPRTWYLHVEAAQASRVCR
jgi:hypothetical protein